MMEYQSSVYSQLEHYDFCNLTPRRPFKTETVSFYDGDEHLVYREEYEDIQSLKIRILELDREWKAGHIYQNEKCYLMLSLNNRWGDNIFVGICQPLGFHLGAMSCHTLEFINKSRYIEEHELDRSYYEFYMPIEMVCNFQEITSEALAWQLIEEWLETGKYTQYFVNMSGQIQTREYIYSNPI